MNYKYIFLCSKFALLVIYIFSLLSCKKLIEIEAPINTTNQENVFNSEINAISVLTSIYEKFSYSDIRNEQITGVSLYAGLSADELNFLVTESGYQPYYTNNLVPNIGSAFWSNIYPVVFLCNSAIEGLANSINLSSTVKNQLIGEAKFVRAFCYFYLINLYGDVPLAMSTDYKVNGFLKRDSTVAIYRQIIRDLEQASQLLSGAYLDKTLQSSTSERVRPTKWAALAMLARAHLYQKNWSAAESATSEVINNTALFDTVSLEGVFLANSRESIWQLQPVNFERNTEDAWVFKIPTDGPDGSHPVFLSSSLLNSFEDGDQRRVKWVDSVLAGSNIFYFPNKYISATLGDPVTEYATVLRLAELYLIRAEARAQQNRLGESKEDLNIIRERAGMAATHANDLSTILKEILQERQSELFTEWGHRWFDLKRTGSVDSTMATVSPSKGGNWASYKQNYPISQSELFLNPNLKQTPGY